MEILIDGIPHIPLEEAARRIGTTPPRILLLMRQGVMKGCRANDEWFVSIPTLACFRSCEQDAARPGKCGAGCSTGGCGGH